MEVILSEERSQSLEELEKIKPFLPIFRKHARFLGLPISIDVPHGDVAAPVEDEKLHIHIYSNPTAANGKERILFKIFGFRLPRKEIKKLSSRVIGAKITRIVGNDAASALAVNKSGDNLLSPERDVIAKICSRNIYILFDFFHQEWEGQKIVLEQILEEAIPRALLVDQKNPLWVQRQVRIYQENLARYCHRKFRGNKKDIGESFAELCTRVVNQKLAETQSSLEKLREEHETLTQELASSYYRLGILENQLKVLKDSAEVYSIGHYEEEFDLLLKTKQIRGVEIKKDEQNEEAVVVYTDRLFLKNEKGQDKWDIGNFEIWIYPGRSVSVSTSAVTWCRIKQGSYTGPYTHQEVNKWSVCFGNEAEVGYNEEVNKLYLDGDFASIIHWALVLLEMDCRGALRSPEAPVSEYVPPTEPFYSSEKEKNKARRAYAEMVKYVREKKIKEELNKELQRVQDSLQKQLEKFAEVRTSLKNTLWIRDELEEGTVVCYHQSQQEFINLSEDQRVVEIKPLEGLLQVLVKGKRGRDLALARIWIYPFMGKIWVRSSDSSLEKNIPGPEDKEAFYKMLLELITRGKLSKTAALIYDFVFLGG